MHDPMVVAHEIPYPWPSREKWREKTDAKRYGRWGLYRRRRTNQENLGEPVFPWWRPAGWIPRFAGRTYGARHLVTIWHVEPGGRDAFEICKHASRWKWHIWHWHFQVHPTQKLGRVLFERCVECGRGYPWGYAPISHQWDGPRSRWFRISRCNFHHECSSLVQLRQQRGKDEELIRHLFAALRVQTDESERELLGRLTDPKARHLDFGESYRLTRLLGYERDDDYRLIKPSPGR